MRRLIKSLMAALCLTGMAVESQASVPVWHSGATVPDWTVPSTYPTGSAPADADEPADISDSIVDTDWLNITDNLGGAFLVNPTRERKIRLQCEPVGVITKQDFILKTMAHLHAPFGLVNWDQNSNFASARANPSSGCMGGPLFSQIYIEPLMMTVLANGATVGIRPQYQTVYYILGLQNDPHNATWVRRETQFIGGASPTNYNDTARRAVYAAAGYKYPGSPDTPAGFGGIQCYNGPTQSNEVIVSRVASRYKTDAGIDKPGVGGRATFARHVWASSTSLDPSNDPWGGQCVGYSAAVPALILFNLNGPGCWDGTYMQADDGRGHMWYMASKPDSSIVDGCPTTTTGTPYRKVPDPQFKTQFTATGPTEYSKWILSSDKMRMPTTECPDAAAPCDGVSGGNVPGTVGGVFYTRVSLDPCRATGPDFCPGSTFHFDWGYGAKSAIFEEGQRECLGITVRGVAPVSNAGGAECLAGVLSRYRGLKYNTASPNPALSGGCTTIMVCYDSIPSKPKEYYVAVPNEATGPLHLMKGM